MTKLKLTLAGRVLTASASDRTITGLLLPYGQEGSTNLGRLTCNAGSITIPDDLSGLVLTVEHEGTRPVGRFTEVIDTAAGMTATFSVARTRAGDDVLEEAAEGLRAALSVEIDAPVIRAGALRGGTLSGAAVVVRPAFPSALLVAADAGDLPDELPPDSESVSETRETIVVDGIEYVRRTTSTYTTETTPTTDPDDIEPDDTDQEDTIMGDSRATATAPAGGLAAARAGRGTTTMRAKSTGKVELFELLASAPQDRDRVLAALSDIVPANTVAMEQPQYVGELWDGKAYERRIIPLFNHADLTSFKVRGWRWRTKPRVAPYAGNKTAVPSNTVATQQVDIDASRIAGAHDIDRKFVDFNDSAFFEAYFAAMTESYAEVSDAEVLDDVIAAATSITRGAVPAAMAAGIVSVVDGALSVLNETRTLPTFALVATDLWRDILLTPKDKTLEYLSSGLSLEEGSMGAFRLVPAPELDAGQVLVGAKSAVTVHELGGPAPIRVDAVDVARGGVDRGVFGYYAVNVHDPAGLVLVSPAGA